MFEYRFKFPIPDTDECYWKPVPVWALTGKTTFTLEDLEYRVHGKIFTEPCEEFTKFLTWEILKHASD